MGKAISVILILFTMLNLVACSSNQEQKLQLGTINISQPQSKEGTIINNVAIEIYSSDKLVETGTGEYDLKPEIYTIKVAATNYKSFDKEYSLQAGQEINITPVLQSKKQEINIIDVNLDRTTARVKVGTDFNLPLTGTAEMSDGSSKEIAIKWQQKVDTSSAGEYLFTGNIEDSDLTVKFTLIVEKESEQNSFSLDLPEEIKVGEKVSFTGQVTGIITKIRIKVDGYLLKVVDVVAKNYQLDYTFTNAGKDRELLVQALNENDEVVASTKEKITVLEKPSFSLNYPDEIIVGEKIHFNGEIKGAIKKIRIKVDDYLLKVVDVIDKQYNLEYKFSHPGENRELLVQALNDQGEIIASKQEKITVLSAASKLLQGQTIVIDAGHGGSDSGAVGYSGYLEKSFNLIIALKLKELLTQTSAEIIMTRNSDRFIELRERSVIANQSGADLFLSIHANSFPSEIPEGTETYIHTEADIKTQQLAQKLQDAMLEALETTDRGVKKANYSVLRNTTCQSILVEAGFLSNPNDEELLKQKEKQQKLATMLYQAIINNYNDYIF
mgnify:CR=1 FL=1